MDLFAVRKGVVVMSVSELKPTADQAPGGARRGWLDWNWRRLTRELVYVAIFAVMYEELREVLGQDGSVDARHALSIVSAERTLGLFHEQALHAVFIISDPLVD